MQIVKSVVLKTNATKRQIVGVLFEFKAQYIKKVLWLKKDKFLVVCDKDIGENKSLTQDEIFAFAKGAVNEVEVFSRLLGILLNKTWQLSALGDQFASIVNNEGFVSKIKLHDPFSTVGPNLPVTLHNAAVSVLMQRPVGTRLYYDGNATNSASRKVAEYFRLIEAGFGLKGSRLKKPLLAFLNAGDLGIKASDWDESKSLRDKLSHAYNSNEILFDSDANPHVYLLQSIAADVLLHKKNWGARDSERTDKNYFSSYTKRDGTMVVTSGHDFSAQVQVFDPITGLAVILDPSDIGGAFSRYAEAFSKTH